MFKKKVKSELSNFFFFFVAVIYLKLNYFIYYSFKVNLLISVLRQIFFCVPFQKKNEAREVNNDFFFFFFFTRERYKYKINK